MSARPNRLWLALWGIFAGALIANAISWFKVATVDAFGLGSLLHDDGYYYLMIAQHIVAGQGATFDGLHPTSGFQPLYQGLTVLLALFSQWTKTSVFRWIFFGNLALACLAAWIISQAVGRLSTNPRPAIVYLFAGILLPLNFPLVLKRLGAGMEMALGLLLLSLLLQVMCSDAARQYNHWFRLREGLLLAALTLTRVDYALLAVVFAAYVVWTWRRRFLKPLAAFATGYLLPIAAYALFAARFLDSIIPVSLLAKQYYSSAQIASLTTLGHITAFLKHVPQIWSYPFGYAAYGFYWQWGNVGLAAAVLVIAGCAGYLIYANWAALRAALRPGFAWFALAVLIHSIWLAWFGGSFISAAVFWYYTPELLLILVFLILLFAVTADNPARLAQSACAGLALIFLASTALYSLDQDMDSYAPYRQAVRSVQALTPSNAVIGSWDAGYNAYWLQPRTVINLDGMVNTRQYLTTVVESGDLSGYVAEQRIRYILNMVPATADARATVYSRYFVSPSIARHCYEVLAEMPFTRQNLDIYLLQYKCPQQ